MAENDNAFKKLLEFHPEDFVARFMPGAAYLQSLSIELPREPRRADALLLVRYPAVGGEECILHLEMQTSADPTMAARLCEYALLAYRREQRPVHSTVIYLQKTATPVSPWQMIGPLGAIMDFHFQIIKLWEEPVEQWLASGQLGILPFTPLLRGATLATLDTVVPFLEHIPDDAERSSALNFLLLFATRAFGIEAINDYLRRHAMNDSYFTESPWYQMILQRGIVEGVTQGVTRGMSQGRSEGTRHTIKLVLQGRFGTLDGDLLTALDAANETKLDDIAVHLATDSLAEVRARLGLA